MLLEYWYTHSFRWRCRQTEKLPSDQQILFSSDFACGRCRRSKEVDLNKMYYQHLFLYTMTLNSWFSELYKLKIYILMISYKFIIAKKILVFHMTRCNELWIFFEIKILEVHPSKNPLSRGKFRITVPKPFYVVVLYVAVYTACRWCPRTTLTLYCEFKLGKDICDYLTHF